jgi:hypothetical protein
MLHAAGITMTDQNYLIGTRAFKVPAVHALAIESFECDIPKMTVKISLHVYYLIAEIIVLRNRMKDNFAINRHCDHWRNQNVHKQERKYLHRDRQFHVSLVYRSP